MVYIVPNTMMTIGDFYNHVQIVIQTRGYEIAVIYDRVCLSSKVNLKEFRSQQIQIQSLETTVLQLGEKIGKLEQGISSLTQVLLESKSWNQEDQQLKSIEGTLQQLKRALVE